MLDTLLARQIRAIMFPVMTPMMGMFVGVLLAHAWWMAFARVNPLPFFDILFIYLFIYLLI